LPSPKRDIFKTVSLISALKLNDDVKGMILPYHAEGTDKPQSITLHQTAKFAAKAQSVESK